ncbi:hypothetical protein DLAC_05988 [Tieghemostelium lacteum]|uniref:Trm112p-like protein n=1 Tax=Tieghemostelium lacteum TaxID=361077 RepID=A0A151ZHG4_TIELA|nr:hypothetical protein DLAC_05988 [Tieghemostelium lacteum]|eukprot:KYQ93320.1 hypothetical protein DLAC_05988 [Tieghemostelium lacteum]
MKILTYNMMSCSKKQCVGKGHPLKLDCTESQTLTQDFQLEFIKNMIPRLDWDGIRAVAPMFNINLGDNIEGQLENEEFLKNLFKLVVNTKIIKGKLTCPSCNREYFIENGIPNMLLREDEIYQDIKE